MRKAMAQETAELAVTSCPAPAEAGIQAAAASSDAPAAYWSAEAIVEEPGKVAAVVMTFDLMLEKFQAEIYRYAMQLTRNPTDADDLYQETLMKAYRAFARLDADANHRAWLYRIATNTFLSDRRKRGREDILDDVAASALPAAPTDHAGRLDARDLLSEVATFIDGLPPKQRVALTLRKYHELDYADIATTLKCSEAAARASVHEALRKLRDCFGDRL